MLPKSTESKPCNSSGILPFTVLYCIVLEKRSFLLKPEKSIFFGSEKNKEKNNHYSYLLWLLGFLGPVLSSDDK